MASMLATNRKTLKAAKAGSRNNKPNKPAPKPNTSNRLLHQLRKNGIRSSEGQRDQAMTMTAKIANGKKR